MVVGAADAEGVRPAPSAANAGRCGLCSITEAVAASDRVLGRCGGLVAVPHPAPRLAGGVLITTTAHDAGGELPADALATLLTELWPRCTQDGQVGANCWLAVNEHEGWHPYAEVQPRGAGIAGFELALGRTVCAADPAAGAGGCR